MKTRLVSSLALAAAIALGATGCGLTAPMATLDPYAPSDGIDLTVAGVDVRNLMLIAAEDGEHFNVVFTAVNTTDSAEQLRINFEGASAPADFVVETGSTLFGDPEGEQELVLVSIPGLKVGAAAPAYLQVAGGQDVQRQVPVLDGTLVEYQRFVVPGPVVDPIPADDAEVEDEATES
ncbi:DNA modification methylase [Leucobacter soli]|uniref:DNA modification methylase n=1 Tax=Leucobacter soli TaxID=2812850 RepID=A0A916JUP4_9MICO|nr:DNA modification methylase [Leucobacter soli]CAG7604138.1 hypothetical protein LEUCIP111803_00706 [Leucobacter soli]